MECKRIRKLDAKYMPKYSVYFEGKTETQIEEFWNNLYITPYDLKDKIEWGKASRYEIFQYIIYSNFITEIYRRGYKRTSKKFYKYFVESYSCLRQELEELKYSKDNINQGSPYII